MRDLYKISFQTWALGSASIFTSFLLFSKTPYVLRLVTQFSTFACFLAFLQTPLPLSYLKKKIMLNKFSSKQAREASRPTSSSCDPWTLLGCCTEPQRSQSFCTATKEKPLIIKTRGNSSKAQQRFMLSPIREEYKAVEAPQVQAKTASRRTKLGSDRLKPGKRGNNGRKKI